MDVRTIQILAIWLLLGLLIALLFGAAARGSNS